MPRVPRTNSAAPDLGAKRQALRAVDDAFVARAHLRAADPVVRRYRRLLRASWAVSREHAGGAE